MKSIRGIAGELLSLVVDDWRLAFAIIAWLAVVWLMALQLHIAGIAGCIGLFVGISAILSESAWRVARHQRQMRPERKRFE